MYNRSHIASTANCESFISTINNIVYSYYQYSIMLLFLSLIHNIRILVLILPLTINIIGEKRRIAHPKKPRKSLPQTLDSIGVETWRFLAVWYEKSKL